MFRFAPVTLGFCALSAFSNARADVVPASPFTDHMVLQRGLSTPVFGTASPGEAVTVALNGQSVQATAGADGRWMVQLKNLAAGGPYTLSLRGKNQVQLQDVLVGEVWLASGQSNMDFTVAKTTKYYFAGVQNEAEEVAAANYPQLRMFKGDWKMAATPQPTAPGKWLVCTPENVREFSAVGYFFARDLQRELKVPVGIIAQTFGASTAEAWIRREALATIPEGQTRLAAYDAAVQAFAAPPVPDAAPAPIPIPVAPNNPAATAPATTAPVTTAPVTTAPVTTAPVTTAPATTAPVTTAPVTTAVAPTAPAPRPARRRDPVQDQHNPTVLYNGMIAAIVPYGIKGVLWYQGESIVDGAAGVRAYPKIQAKLVEDWRSLWNNPDLPFYIVQLAAYSKAGVGARAAQATILQLPHTGMAVTIDIGDETNVHPKNKQDVGDRLTRIALFDAYGQKIEASGPVYRAMKVEGNLIRLSFDHLGGGLLAKGATPDAPNALGAFEIAGADGQFVPATARIDGSSVVVSSAALAAPTAVRYAWKPFPDHPNLFNAAGLPAAPFQTLSPN